jgi:uncharacterized protein YerC
MQNGSDSRMGSRPVSLPPAGPPVSRITSPQRRDTPVLPKTLKMVQMVREGWTCQEVARRFGVSRQRVHAACVRRGVRSFLKKGSRGSGYTCLGKIKNKEHLEKLKALDQNRRATILAYAQRHPPNLSEIAAKFGVSRRYILRTFRRAGISRRSIRSRLTREPIARLLKQGKTYAEIRKALGVCYMTIWRVRKACASTSR